MVVPGGAAPARTMAAGHVVEGLLLFGRELGVESLGGIAELLHAGGALGLALLHQVDALRCGELLELAALLRRARRRLQGGGVGGPGAFLRRGDLQPGLQIDQAVRVLFGHALLHPGGMGGRAGGRGGRRGLRQRSRRWWRSGRPAGGGGGAFHGGFLSGKNKVKRSVGRAWSPPSLGDDGV